MFRSFHERESVRTVACPTVCFNSPIAKLTIEFDTSEFRKGSQREVEPFVIYSVRKSYSSICSLYSLNAYGRSSHGLSTYVGLSFAKGK